MCTKCSFCSLPVHPSWSAWHVVLIHTGIEWEPALRVTAACVCLAGLNFAAVAAVVDTSITRRQNTLAGRQSNKQANKPFNQRKLKFATWYSIANKLFDQVNKKLTNIIFTHTHTHPHTTLTHHSLSLSHAHTHAPGVG